MYRETRVDWRSIEMEVEREVRFEKNRLQAADRCARKIKEEKESRL